MNGDEKEMEMEGKSDVNKKKREKKILVNQRNDTDPYKIRIHKLDSFIVEHEP